jgi:hypothetical protein
LRCCSPIPFVPIQNGKVRPVVTHRSWEEMSDEENFRRWGGATMNETDTNPMRKTMGVWPYLVDVDGRFLPIDVSGNSGMMSPETKGHAESPLRNIAEKGYRGEDTTVTPIRLKMVERRKLDLPVELSVVAKRCFTTPMTARPSQVTVGEIWCHPESKGRYKARWRPIQNFPRYNAWSAVAEALPERCDVGALLRNFWLLTRGCIRQRSKQQTADSQIINS